MPYLFQRHLKSTMAEIALKGVFESTFITIRQAICVFNLFNEMSIYVSEGSWRNEETRERRYTLRIDGFVSLQAPLSGGEFVTRPILFEGKELVMNYSTSAAGSVRVGQA